MGCQFHFKTWKAGKGAYVRCRIRGRWFSPGRANLPSGIKDRVTGLQAFSFETPLYSKTWIHNSLMQKPKFVLSRVLCRDTLIHMNVYLHLSTSSSIQRKTSSTFEYLHFQYGVGNATLIQLLSGEVTYTEICAQASGECTLRKCCKLRVVILVQPDPLTGSCPVSTLYVPFLILPSSRH